MNQFQLHTETAKTGKGRGNGLQLITAEQKSASPQPTMKRFFNLFALLGFLVFAAFAPQNLHAQYTLIWEEVFDESNGAITGTASGAAATSWSTDHSTLAVSSGNQRLQGFNLGALRTWSTGPININGYSSISIYMNIGEDGTAESDDIITCQYSYDNSTWTTLTNGSQSGQFTTASPFASGLSGTSLYLRVQIDNDGSGSGDETHWLDNVQIYSVSCTSGPVTLPFTEGFETVGSTLSFTTDQSSINGLCNWSYDEVGSNGRVQFNVVSRTGVRAAVLDKSTESGGNETNYLILTLDLSNYTCSKDLALSFWHREPGMGNDQDEDHTNDRVWIRGNNSATWLEIHDLDLTANQSTWTSVSGLDIDALLSANSQSPSSTFQIRFGQQDDLMWTSGNQDGRAFDDITISGTNSPSLTVSPASLDFGYVASGGTSSELTYTLSGSCLSPASGNITVTTPSNFEVSLTSGSGFGSSVNVPYTGSALAATTIYVRFKPTSPNTDYSGNVTNGGGGATTQNVAVSGTSTPLCTGNAIAVQSQTGVTNPTNATGAVNGTFAQLADQNDQMALELDDLLDAGGTLVVTWRRASGTSSNPTVSVEISEDASTWTTVTGSPFTVTVTDPSWTTQSIALSVDTRYIRFTTTNVYDLDIDAVVYTSQPCTPPCNAYTATIADNATICTGGSTNLTVTMSGGASPYTVVYTDGSTNFTEMSYTSGSNISVSPTTTTTYTLVSVADDGNCPGTTAGSAVVTVVADPVAPVIAKSPNTATVCEGATLTITVTTAGSGGTGSCTDEYRYSTNNGSSWSSWGPSLPSFAAVTGTNLVESRRNCDGSGCNSNVNQVSWTVVADPVAPAIAKSPNTAAVCEGTTLTITVTTAGSGGTGSCTDEYRHSTNNGSSWSSWGPSLPSFAAVTGTNLVESRRSCDGSGCASNVNQVSWTVNARPTAGTCNVLNDPCQTSSGQLDIQASGGLPPYSVTWSPAHGTPTQPATILSSGGTLTVMGLQGGVMYTFTIVDANNCQAP